MKSFQVLAVTVGFISVLAACSAGGRGRALGTQCPSNLAPVPMDVDANIADKLDLETQVPEGDYEYEGAELYYVDSASDFRILVRDARQRTGEIKPVIGCIRNARAGAADQVVKVVGVSQLKVEANNKMTFEVKNYGFTMSDTKLIPVIVPLGDGEPKPTSPKDVYTGEGVTDSFVYKTKNQDTNIEIRSSGITESGTYSLLVRFRKKPPVVAAP